MRPKLLFIDIILKMKIVLLLIDPAEFCSGRYDGDYEIKRNQRSKFFYTCSNGQCTRKICAADSLVFKEGKGCVFSN